MFRLTSILFSVAGVALLIAAVYFAVGRTLADDATLVVDAPEREVGPLVARRTYDVDFRITNHSNYPVRIVGSLDD